eukprot:GHRQ01031827.1.p2 GENE.GHRQ01031827.1~~GHRQ01031827.1.p2  ORF type:complete len:102 (-),score=31.87 GHRQ01031827.1:887-1192(-)
MHCSSCTSACLLHVCAALAASVFRAYPQQRSTVMDEVLTTVVDNISLLSSRGAPRLFAATDAAQRPLPIMMASALVMQLVQVSRLIPSVLFMLACNACLHT